MNLPPKKHRYKHVEGKHWIEVRVKSPQQLFDVRDPAPFRERDLDDDFIEYIVSSAMELSSRASLKLVIYIQDSESTGLTKESIREAIYNHLHYQIELNRTLLKRFLKRAQFFLLIGIFILTACLVAAQKIGTDPGGGLEILREGLIIFGWVSLWKPIELVLFDWYPLYEKLSLFKNLMMAEIEVRFSSQ